MADNQETISEHVRKTIEDCKKSTGRVSLNEQGRLIVKIDDTVADLPIVTTEHFGDQRLKYMLVPIGEDGQLRESPAIIFTRKSIDDLMGALLTTTQPRKKTTTSRTTPLSPDRRNTSHPRWLEMLITSRSSARVVLTTKTPIKVQ